jgi:hypothetical protein
MDGARWGLEGLRGDFLGSMELGGARWVYVGLGGDRWGLVGLDGTFFVTMNS